uniref:Uncharacterized protein n=1 Tax=Clastoptera arizonana TaxID=38151 RepID=A0A1B6C9P1_9HEMI
MRGIWKLIAVITTSILTVEMAYIVENDPDAGLKPWPEEGYKDEMRNEIDKFKQAAEAIMRKSTESLVLCCSLDAFYDALKEIFNKEKQVVNFIKKTMIKYGERVRDELQIYALTSLYDKIEGLEKLDNLPMRKKLNKMVSAMYDINAYGHKLVYKGILKGNEFFEDLLGVVLNKYQELEKML